jgi:hypothetical protein
MTREDCVKGGKQSSLSRLRRVAVQSAAKLRHQERMAQLSHEVRKCILRPMDDYVLVHWTRQGGAKRIAQMAEAQHAEVMKEVERWVRQLGPD